MEATTYLKVPYPSEGDEPFFTTYESQMASLDEMIFCTKIQNNLFVAGGGTKTLTPSTNTLTWTADFVIPVFYYGKKITIPYGPGSAFRQVQLLDGQALGVDIPMVMQDNTVGQMQVYSQLTPANHQTWIFAWRYGNNVFFKGMSQI
jgi:hypothetical protein